MKKVAAIIASAGLLVGTALFAAQPAANNAGNINIGVVDLSQVLKNSPQMKSAAEKLKKEFKPRQEKILSAQKTFQADQAKLKRNGSVMSESELEDAKNKLSDEGRDLQRMQEDYQQDIQTAQQQAMQGVLAQIDKIVQNIASKDHYDVIFQRNGVAYASSRVDITAEVIKALK